jgi:hypothetical protein
LRFKIFTLPPPGFVSSLGERCGFVKGVVVFTQVILSKPIFKNIKNFEQVVYKYAHVQEEKGGGSAVWEIFLQLRRGAGGGPGGGWHGSCYSRALIR